MMNRNREKLLSPLGEQVRQSDPPRYLATLFAPAGRRESLFALYALDHEIARVRRVTTEPMAGLIRLQWWRDALGGIVAGQPLAHPVIQGLVPAFASGALRPELLAPALDAREDELEAPEPGGLAALERRLAATHGTMVRAALHLLGTPERSLDPVADRIGMACGWLELLQLLAPDPARGLAVLPPEMLRAHRLDLAGEPEAAAVASVARDLSARGLGHLRAARAALPTAPPAALPALFPGTLAGRELRRLQRTGAPTGPPAARGGGAPLHLLWCWIRKRY